MDPGFACEEGVNAEAGYQTQTQPELITVCRKTQTAMLQDSNLGQGQT